MRKLLRVETPEALAIGLSSAADSLLCSVESLPGASPGLATPKIFASVRGGEAPWPPLPGVALAGILLGSAAARDVQRAAARLAVLEAERDLDDGALRILATAGDPAALLALVARTEREPRLAGLLFDGARLAGYLAVDPTAEPVVVARGLCLLAAAALGVPAFDATAVPGDFRTADATARGRGFAAAIARSPQELQSLDK